MERLGAGDPSRIGAYRLLGRLGAGGMGNVYLARSDRGRTVAVKLVRAELAEREEFRARFRQEVGAARRVGGYWTAPVLDADTEAAVPWVATGYVAGPSLQQVVGHDHGALPERSVRILAAGLAHALQDIHAAGIVHRDLKPSNVLVTIDGPRVIDFGIARALETTSAGEEGLTRTGSLVGSPGFMAPEQVRGDRITPACDVFCLGSVLAYAATGALPFGSADSGVHALMFRIAQEEPDLTGVPEGIAELVRHCLRKDPGARPSLPAILERTGAQDTVSGGRSLDPWLPSTLVAQLGRHAVRLLDTEDPEGAEAGAGVGVVPGAGAGGAGAGSGPGAGFGFGFPPSPPVRDASPGAGGPGGGFSQSAGASASAGAGAGASGAGAGFGLPSSPPVRGSSPGAGGPGGGFSPSAGAGAAEGGGGSGAFAGKGDGGAEHGAVSDDGAGPSPTVVGQWGPPPAPDGYGYPRQRSQPWGTYPYDDGGLGTGQEPERRDRRSTALLVAAALVVAVGAGGTVYALMRNGAATDGSSGGGTASPAPVSSSAPAEGGASGPPTRETPSPSGSVPDAYLGTWETTIGGAGTRELTIRQGEVGDAVLTLVADGSTEGGGSYHCVFEATLSERPDGQGPLEIGPSTVTSGRPASSCAPGEPTEVTLLPDGTLKRTKRNGGESLTYTKR
ncbi:serine/threonine protein kinase [Streptomyces sp. LP11]|uniref:Serine/threonine protein kinase n=1 Tax=Streptomyces pyxinicus TaxID=2970331 RepID=A0ABT2AYA1_9ACTN|nr:serine/threonine-protein kinase [Streptomyces sp. LP11]MCS0601210.1 serine/threonine protein kinase [Streptomyces sp. LP11]